MLLVLIPFRQANLVQSAIANVERSGHAVAHDLIGFPADHVTVGGRKVPETGCLESSHEPNLASVPATTFVLALRNLTKSVRRHKALSAYLPLNFATGGVMPVGTALSRGLPP